MSGPAPPGSSWTTGIPNLADFLTFLASNGIPPANLPAALPASSPFPQYALNNALAVVNSALQAASGLIYVEAVYNLAASNLLNYCPDQAGVIYQDGLGIFAFIRQKWDMTSFIGGTIASTSDEGTSEALEVPDYFKLFTVADLQSLKDPFGRRYIGIAQKYGPNLWGLT